MLKKAKKAGKGKPKLNHIWADREVTGLIGPVKEFLKEFANDDDNRILNQF